MGAHQLQLYRSPECYAWRYRHHFLHTAALQSLFQL